jgi:hypothetical protein
MDSRKRARRFFQERPSFSRKLADLEKRVRAVAAATLHFCGRAAATCDRQAFYGTIRH